MKRETPNKPHFAKYHNSLYNFPMTHLMLSFLDTFQVLKAQQQITHFRSNNVRCLLVFLAMQADRPFAREVLATLFWPDESSSIASKNLRQILYRLRKAIGETDENGEPFFIITRQMIQLNPHCDFAVDVQQFLQAIQEEDWATAVTLYKGDLLPGFTADSLAFEEWLRQERETLHQLAMEAFSTLGEQHVQNGHLEQAQAVIRKQLTLEPWRELAHQQLMLILAQLGDRGGALAQYELCRQQLWEELGIEPMAETVMLAAEIKEGKYSQTIETQPFIAPKPLYSLPKQPTPLIGREAELQHLSTLLLTKQKRLITLIGVGGMGKTRLALALAHQPSYYGSPQHGVAFVPLASLNDAGQIVSAVADTLNFSLSSGDTQRNDQQQLFDYLHQKEMLLVLDNFEHLLNGARFVDDLLQHAPQIRIIATSRERLNLQGEQLYPVQGLTFPEPAFGQFPMELETIKGFTAVQLFTQTAQRIQPHFDLQNEDLSALMRICHLLDGMPLAVELAAGWADMLSVAEIAAELESSADFLETDMRNVPTRHRSMRAVFDASWQRLSHEEQAIFAQLTTFQGGFTRQAAQTVTGTSLRLLGRLVNKSLLHYDHSRLRYQIHELLRQYGAEQLGQDQALATAVAQAHSQHYLKFLHQQTARLKSQAQQQALAEIELELGNIRTAWSSAKTQKSFVDLNQAVDSLRLFYQWKGLYQASAEAAVQLITTLTPPNNSTEQHLLAKALLWQAHVTHIKGNHTLTRQLLEQATVLLEGLPKQAVDVQPEQIEHLLLTGQLFANTDFKQAYRIYEEATQLATLLNDEWYQARSLRYWGMTAYSLGEYETAEAHLQQALTLAQNAGDGRLQALILDELGQLTAQLARIDEAEAYVRQSYAIYHSFADPLNLAMGTGKLGIILVFAGKHAEAERLLIQSLGLFQELGDEGMLAQSYVRLGIAQTYFGKSAEGHNHIQQGLTLYRQLNKSGFTGWALWALGESYLAQAEFEAARKTFIEGAELLTQARRLDMVSWTLGLRGLTAVFLENDAEARLFLKRGLQYGSETREYLAVLSSIAGVALLQARIGQLEKAAELYALICRYPFGEPSNKGWSARLHDALQPLLAQLPPDVAKQAAENGQKLDLWETTTTLFNELSSEDASS